MRSFMLWKLVVEQDEVFGDELSKFWKFVVRVGLLSIEDFFISLVVF